VLKAIEKVQPQTAGIGYELLARKTAENMNINLLFGSYQIYGDKIQITTKLVEVKSGIVKPLIMETYSLDDPLSMQSDISDKISVILKSKNNSIN
jgi:TolB-like protein